MGGARKLSASSTASTASSTSSVITTNKTQAFTQIFKNMQQQSSTVENLPMEKMIMEIKLNKRNSKILTPNCVTNSNNDTPNKLAIDSYQGLMALSLDNGDVEIFDFQGFRKHKISTANKNRFTILKFFPNKPFLMGINIQLNEIQLTNYQTNEITKILLPSDFEEDEKLSCLYIPEFLAGKEENQDFAFIGTDKQKVLIFSLCEKIFISQIKNLIRGDYSIVDIKSNHKKPHRLLLTYQSTDSSQSTVIVYSIYKNKISQQLDFKPSSQRELGQVLSSCYSPDCSKLAIVFQGGKVQIFKAKSKLDKGKPVPIQSLDLDYNSYLNEAQISWKSLPDGSGRNSMCVCYSYKFRSEIQSEVGIFLSKSKEGNFEENHFLNTLPNQDEGFSYCSLVDLMISNQNEQIGQLLDESLDKSKKKELKIRSQKQSIIKSVMIVALSTTYKVYYLHPEKIKKDQDDTQESSFKILPNHFCFQNGKLKFFEFVDLTKISQKAKESFIQYVEELSFCKRKEDFYDTLKNDQRFHKAKAHKSEKLLKYSTVTELQSYMLQGSIQVENDQIIGYSIGITSNSEIIIGRVEKDRAVLILNFSLRPFLQNDRVSGLVVDSKLNKIIIALRNSQTLFELIFSQTVLKNKNLTSQKDFSTLELLPMKTKETNKSEDAKVTKIMMANNNGQSLLIQGFSNGRVKVISMINQKVIVNAKVFNDSNSISAVDYSTHNDTTRIYCSTSNGHIFSVIINNKESKVSKPKQVTLSKIKQIVADVPNSDNLFLITEKQIIQIEKQKFSVKLKYDLSDQKSLNPKESFKQFQLLKISDGQYALACLLQKAKWLVMFDAESLICYCVYDLKQMGLNVNSFFSLKGIEESFITCSQTSSLSIFTLKKELPYADSQPHSLFDESLCTEKFPNSSKKPLISSIFSKSITIQKSLSKHLKKDPKRSKSLCAVRQVEKNEEVKERKRLESSDKKKVKKGYAILSRNNNQQDSIEEELSIVSRGKKINKSRRLQALQDSEESSKNKKTSLSSLRRKSHWV